MTSKLLLPNKFKLIGWCLFIPSALLLLILSIKGGDTNWLNMKVFAIFSDEIFGEYKWFRLVKTDVTFTILGILLIVGAMMVGFSKEKKEDEFISKLRLSSLLWAVWINYSLLSLAFLFLYGTVFLDVMAYNMFTVLVIFIIRFNYMLYRYSKTATDEK